MGLFADRCLALQAKERKRVSVPPPCAPKYDPEQAGTMFKRVSFSTVCRRPRKRSLLTGIWTKNDRLFHNLMGVAFRVCPDMGNPVMELPELDCHIFRRVLTNFCPTFQIHGFGGDFSLSDILNHQAQRKRRQFFIVRVTPQEVDSIPESAGHGDGLILAVFSFCGFVNKGCLKEGRSSWFGCFPYASGINSKLPVTYFPPHFSFEELPSWKDPEGRSETESSSSDPKQVYIRWLTSTFPVLENAV
eukprot:Gregarina_sp_Poly_1__9794@NODE_625_length_7080_cov_156_224583_g479_i0_p4_GENE_NODE_625_length_7080_cov_156_224583_g479_i0NODE_625_length_7080_cov_156_224583_g479_i0_p4_ORF_typecomplete_len246_score20_32_NODE_625_length_7080_cov_156_224583_g479_i010811818